MGSSQMNVQARTFQHHCEAFKQLMAKKLQLVQKDNPLTTSSLVKEFHQVQVVEMHDPVVCERVMNVDDGKSKLGLDLGPSTPPQTANSMKCEITSDEGLHEGMPLSFPRHSAAATTALTSPYSSSSNDSNLRINQSHRDGKISALGIRNESVKSPLPDQNSHSIRFDVEAAAADHQATELQLLGRETYCRNRASPYTTFSEEHLQNTNVVSLLIPGKAHSISEAPAECLGSLQYAEFQQAGAIPKAVGVHHQSVLALEVISVPPAPNGVSLELNIGPGDSNSRRALSGIHANKRSGFSRCLRPEIDSVTQTRSDSVEMPFWLQSLGAGNALMKSEKLKSELQSPNCNSLAHLRETHVVASITTAEEGLQGVKLKTPEDEHSIGAMDAICTLKLSLGATVENSNHMEVYAQHETHASTASLISFSLKATSLPYLTTSSLPLPHWLENQSSRNAEQPSTIDMLQAAFPTELKTVFSYSKIELAGVAGGSAKPESEREELQREEGAETGAAYRTERETSQGSEVTMMEGSSSMTVLECPNFLGLRKDPTEIPSVHERTLVEYLRAKKQHKEHFLDKIVVHGDVYLRHPWHYTWGDVRGSLYFCCITKYTRRGNMTRDRMTKEGGRWKQQGMVQPIVTARGYDPASKTYLSYIPRGKNNSKCYFIPANPGRVKHRHRMIEIALEEDLASEKKYLKLKATPKPFQVVCVLRKA